MNVSANGKSVVTLTRQLILAWEDTRQHWHDTKADEFEKRFLADLVSAVDRAAPVFDQLEKILARVRSECE